LRGVALDFELLIVILVDGLVYSSYLFLVAVGLTVIFGVQKVLNVTHGSFYAFGAYFAAYLIGLWTNGGLPDWGGFLLILGSALILGVVLGVVIERGLLKYLYGRDEHVMVLATFAAFLVLEDVILLIWGTDPYLAFAPLALLGSTEIAGLIFDVYSLSMISLAFVVALILWYGLNRTQFGKILLAVIFDRELSMAMGINVIYHWHVPRRPGRRLSRANNFGATRDRRGGDRACFRRSGNRRDGIHTGRIDRFYNCRNIPC
jgi:branched-chain amino acid transport system permease protein